MNEPIGYWVAFYSDRSGANVFSNEIEALRHAVKYSMQCEWRNWGDDVFNPERSET